MLRFGSGRDRRGLGRKGVPRVSATELSAPVNIVPPSVSRSAPIVGQELVGTLGLWQGFPLPLYARQWLRNGVPITGATQASYVVTIADLGARISLQVTASNSVSLASAVSVETLSVGQEVVAVEAFDFSVPAASVLENAPVGTLIVALQPEPGVARPATITLSGNKTVMENAPIGTVVGFMIAS